MADSSVRHARVSLEGKPTFIALDAHGAFRTLTGPPWAGGAPAGPERPASALGAAPAWLCPALPSKIIGIGRNYRKHAEELNNEVPAEPLMFLKPPSSLLDPGGTLLLPPESERVDHEGELAVIIGRRARRLTPEQARGAVFGYSVACDVTARDLQTRDKQWTRAKGFDGFCPLGPFVVALDDPGALRIQLSVNGDRRQDGSTRDMIFDVPSLVAYASQALTLEPGDVILTGTPEGVGPLAPGDAVSVCIEGIGVLGFHVAAEAR